MRALDVKTGKQAWDFKLPSPPWAGVMATAGGLVFGGSNEGNFFALDATTGKPLWQFQTGGAIRSGPMSFLADGKQHVAVAGGHALFVFALTGRTMNFSASTGDRLTGSGEISRARLRRWPSCL